MEYKQYLTTEKWAKTKSKVFNLQSKRCAVCRKGVVDVHHKTYKRIFSENVEIDLVPLCRFHHFEIHKFAKEKKIPIFQATNQYIKKHKQKRKNLSWKTMSPLERKTYLGKAL